MSVYDATLIGLDATRDLAVLKVLEILNVQFSLYRADVVLYLQILVEQLVCLLQDDVNIDSLRN